MSPRFIHARLYFSPLALGVLVSIANAQTTAGSTAGTPVWPEKVVVTVGDVRTRIDGPKLWTMSGIDYQNAVMATEDSAYGTVVTIRGVGHLGTAHFLDVSGKPSEVEKENVTGLKLFVDDKPITRFEPTMAVTGRSFRMERTSKIRALDLVSMVLIRDGVLVETSRWHATRAIDLEKSYPLMYAWTPAATHYAFGDENGLQKRGVFRKDGKSDDSGLEKSACWMAVFDTASGKGSVCYLAKKPPNVETFLQWTDAPHVYRKLRVMTFVNRVVPEGFEGVYQSAVGCFSADETDWETNAVSRLAEVKAFAANLPASE